MPGLIRGQPRSSASPAGMFSGQTSLNDYRELSSLSFSAFRFNNTPHSQVSGPRVLRAKLFLLFVLRGNLFCSVWLLWLHFQLLPLDKSEKLPVSSCSGALTSAILIGELQPQMIFCQDVSTVALTCHCSHLGSNSLFCMCVPSAPAVFVVQSPHTVYYHSGESRW